MKKTRPDGVESPFSFVCFEDQTDKEYGPKCAMAAVQSLHDQYDCGDGMKLYVREALKKADREVEKKKD